MRFRAERAARTAGIDGVTSMKEELSLGKVEGEKE